MSVRLAVLDDGRFVRTIAGEIRPISATFNRFVEAVSATGAFERVTYLIPVRDQRIWEVEPALEPVDTALVDVVPTAAFSGITDYVARLGIIAAQSWPIIDRAVAEADLLWLRLPASNAVLALTAARRHGVPHLSWIAGSAAAVAQTRGAVGRAGVMGTLVGAAYDAATDLAARTGVAVRLDADLFTSIVTADEITATRSRLAEADAAPPGEDHPRRIVWAGRMAAEKGLADLVEAWHASRLRDATSGSR